MKKIIVFSIYVIIAFIACKTTPTENKNAEYGFKRFEPITITGEMSEMTLAYAKRQNYFNQLGQNEIHPDGMVFYFVIQPLGNNISKTPALVELRDFTINGTSYREMTRLNGINEIEPHTIAYSRRSFQGDEFNKRLDVQIDFDTNHLFKVVILGTNIPDNGIIDVVFRFGFDGKVEPFNYQLNVNDIEK
ncbi:MAG: hypothetical protein LBI28_06855 [Treponema sp.]|jgi:hypothetical protein|nr:hypothetical protein [Treponema sp.]